MKLYRKKLSDETKLKISKSNKLVYSKKDLSGKNNPFYGKKHTKETKEKLRMANLGKKSPMKGKKLPPDKGNRKGFSGIKTPHPKCTICGKLIRFDNTIGVCRKHRLLSPIVKEGRRKYRFDNREKIRKMINQYAKKNRDKKSIYDKIYSQKNKERKRPYYAKYRRDRLRSDILYRLINRFRCSTSRAFGGAKEVKKEKTTLQLLGAEVSFVKRYIENQFTEGMTWKNYGEWHIDHIIPLSSGKNKEDIEKLCHYKNLQPLWAIDNLKKGCKLNYQLLTN